MDDNLRAAIAESKQRLRQAVQLRRSVRSAADSAEADGARADLLTEFLDGDLGPDLVVSSYLSRPGEPATLQMIGMLRASGARLLMPSFLGPNPTTDPRWAWFEGPDHLQHGPAGLLQPDGPALDSNTLAQAQVIIVPALAVTETGDRLGTGGGWYDRALVHTSPTAVVVALVNDDEVFDSLPTEQTDVPVDVVITEQRMIAINPG